MEKRLLAIKNVKRDVVAMGLDILFNETDHDRKTALKNPEFLQWLAETSTERHEAAFEFSETGRRYEDIYERKLNIAEHIGKLIWHSVLNKRFEGAQTKTGILRQVSDEAKEAKVSGAKDKDTLRKIWNTYRGVVHLGMAIDYCDDNPNQELNVLHLAELFRRGLCENCPKGTSKPYVDPVGQISFIYLSKLWGPRFQYRELSFDVD